MFFNPFHELTACTEAGSSNLEIGSGRAIDEKNKKVAESIKNYDDKVSRAKISGRAKHDHVHQSNW